MEVLFHFIFQLLKIAFLAFIYSSIIIELLILIDKIISFEFAKKIKSNKRKYRINFGLFISFGLFIYSFTYWGNHGLGDSALIPIGYSKTISNINWTEYGHLNSVQTSDEIKIETTRFKVKNDKLCGNLDSWFYDFDNSYFVLDLKTDELIEFETENEFNKYTSKNDLPESNELLDFRKNYSDFWGIRILLLP